MPSSVKPQTGANQRKQGEKWGKCKKRGVKMGQGGAISSEGGVMSGRFLGVCWGG